MKAPPGYVPGLGRGAAGFMTRSDLGPAVPQAMDLNALQANQTNRRKEEVEEEEAPEGPGVFDRFMGNDTGALAGRPGEFDEDDREADAVWKHIDEKMDERRRSRREAKMEEEMKKQRIEQPQIATMFRDLKRQLADVPPEAWDAIPDVGDYTVKKQKLEKFAPPPDTLLARAAAEKASLAQLDPDVLRATGSGRNESGAPSASADLTSVAEGRGTVLSLQLDRASDSDTGPDGLLQPGWKKWQEKCLQPGISSKKDAKPVRKTRTSGWKLLGSHNLPMLHSSSLEGSPPFLVACTFG
eukprot:jgi/Pico_ML_1/52468/g3169.t1